MNISVHSCKVTSIPEKIHPKRKKQQHSTTKQNEINTVSSETHLVCAFYQ